MSAGDMRRNIPFPFEGGHFPEDLGAVIQRTVLDGLEPARIVVHDGDGDWMIGDGVSDPNEPGACIATHIHHALRADSSIAELASMAPGHMAERAQPGESWRVSPHRYED